MIISPIVEVYRGKTADGHEYVVEHETCKSLNNIPLMRHILTRYPKIRNVYYKWDECTTTEKPSFDVDNSLGILCDVWYHINRLEKGVYLIAANNVRSLNIYRKRWLHKKNNWKLLEAGMLPNRQTYIVIRR